MLKTLKKSLRNEREPFRIPKSVQASIPIERIYKDGIWKVGNNFSKVWKFSDINYNIASTEEKFSIMAQYGEILSSFPADATVKVTINNRKLDMKEFRHSLMLPARADGLDAFRGEYNRMLQDKAEITENKVQEKYITVSISKKNIEEARAVFSRIEIDLAGNFLKLSSRAEVLGNQERLKLLCDFFRPEDKDALPIDLNLLMERGHSFKDYICPDSIQFLSDHFEMDGKVGRVLFLKDYGASVTEDMLTTLTAITKESILSVDVLPIPSDEAVKEMQNKMLSVETDIARWQRKQNENYNFSATIPYELQEMRERTKTFLDDLSTKDERMMYGLLTVLHMADDLKQLDADTEAIKNAMATRIFSVLRWQQEDGLNTVLPYGIRRIQTLRTFTTGAITTLHPFSAQEVRDKGGIFYGINKVSKNLIICNRKNLLNGNAFILGVSGSGKSFMAKEEMSFVAMSTHDDILVIDPEREYVSLIDSLGGEVIRFSPDSENHINPLDMSKEYAAGENPLAVKSSFIMSLYENLNRGSVDGAANSIVDRCMKNIYQAYLSGDAAEPPTLKELRRELLRQEEPLAKDVALVLELFTEGTLNVFSQQTNVDLNNRIMCFDTLDLGDNLKTIGVLIMLDFIMNRVMENRKKGKRTWVYIDEIYLFFAKEYSASFLSESWKRFRKYGAMATGITQNVGDCLNSHMARTMFSNSEFLIMLNQSPDDRESLARLFKMTENQMDYIKDVPAGRGLLKVNHSLVPFINEFPKDTELYRLMTTKPEDR